LSHAESDFRLVDLAKKGDRDAFRRIVERHEAAVAAVVIGMLGTGDEADDVGQETFVRFYRSLSKFRGDAALRTYLSRIAMNLSLNALKRRKKEAGRTLRLGSEPDAPAFADPQMGPERILERDEIQRAVRAAIQGLDEKHRSVVSLRMLQGMSTKEAAEVLGLPEGTVLSRLSRAMKKLEAELEPWMHEE
jgi:RNA polymerase sigma-70 factor (ECF subfamily)